MTNKIFILILVWSVVLGALVWANPPAGTPGTTSGAIIADSTGNIDIGNNASSANNTTKNTKFTFRGRDTVNTSKLVGQIIATPQDANWINSSLGFYTRTSDGSPTEKARIDSRGFFGLGTINPVSPIDIQTAGTGAGAVVIRNGFLNMNNNTIKNLPMPINVDEAATKAYVDAQMGANASKLWGEGRPGTAVINTAGECTVSGIKISRSSRPVTWGSAAAACPAGWWVCSAAERGADDCKPASGSIINRSAIGCDTRPNSGTSIIADELFPQSNDWAWVSDTSSQENKEYGRFINAVGAAGDNEICSMRPVWCCAN